MRLLDFTSKSCVPCEKIKPILSKICSEMKIKLEIIDKDDNAAVAFHYKVMSVPTLILENKDGIEIARREGAGSAGVIRDWIQKAKGK